MFTGSSYIYLFELHYCSPLDQEYLTVLQDLIISNGFLDRDQYKIVQYYRMTKVNLVIFCIRNDITLDDIVFCGDLFFAIFIVHTALKR